uniref:Reversion-inducing cysteine-rich with Kazal motifs N-terminal domain-containing protein n=1 Tax=Poecilia mexicana TaxID=48701 RepID=A0A3B3WJI0_9TELE
MCINSTLPGVSKKSDGWVGLGCCELAIAGECRRECKQASSKNDITKVCKKVTEAIPWVCLSVGSACCGFVGRHTNCRDFCDAIFRTDSTPTESQIKTVKDFCKSHSPKLVECVNNFTESYPARSPIDSMSIFIQQT